MSELKKRRPALKGVVKVTPHKIIENHEEIKTTRFTLDEYIKDPRRILNAAINTFVTIVDKKGVETILTMPRLNAK